MNILHDCTFQATSQTDVAVAKFVLDLNMSSVIFHQTTINMEYVAKILNVALEILMEGYIIDSDISE